MVRPDREQDPPHAFHAGVAKWPSIALLALCVLFSLTLWFSLSAVVPTLRHTQGLSDARAAWLSSSVSVGFVIGTLISALFGLADLFDPRRLFMSAALAGAMANGAILLVDPGSVQAIVLRFLTGVAMAWIYPVGMRIVATWATGDAGLIAAIFTSAICLGSGLPHLVDALGGLDWRVVVATSSLLAASAGLLVNLARLGPGHAQISSFRLEHASRAWTILPIRLANIGYWGHKWENYAMWTWIGTYLLLSYEAASGRPAEESAWLARLATFSVFIVCAIGCVVAGYASDRIGRTSVAILCLLVSGACCILAPIVFGGPLWIVTLVVLVWSFALIADSAQFSASVIELSDRSILGTMLTIQTSVGYLVTLVSIHAVEVCASLVGWRYALAVLALGPLVGIRAMLALRRHPSASRLAGGRR